MTGSHPLEQAEAFYRKYAVFPSSHHHTVLPLWAAHTYVASSFVTTPRLFLDSAVPASGKTRVLELLNLTTFEPMLAFAASPAALIRTIDASDPPRTILFDEVDTIFGNRGNTQAQEIAAVINAGYKAGAVVPRCVGDASNVAVVELKAFAPIALAGLHSNVPDATRSRSIHFRMQKRKPSEKVTAFYQRVAVVEAAPIREGLAGWLKPLEESLARARPAMPNGVEDRPAEIWEPILAIADCAGGDWPRRAREACSFFVFAKNGYARPIGVDLLADMKRLFLDSDRMSTADIVKELHALTDAGWDDPRATLLTPSRMSALLRPFDVRPKNLKVNGRVVKGYVVAGEYGLGEAWERHLTSEDDDGDAVEAATAATAATPQVTDFVAVAPGKRGSGTENSGIAGCKPLTSEVAEVAAVAGSADGGDPVPSAKRWLLAQERSA